MPKPLLHQRNKPPHASSKTKKHAILVVGAPRSGTSAISHVLNEFGIYFGNKDRFVDPSVNRHNPIFFELEELNRLNDWVWAWFGKRYADFDFLPLRSDFGEDLRAEFRRRCVKLIENEFGDAAAIGLKDPRFCFVLPIWVETLESMGFQVRCVWTQRPLDSVIASNARVNRDFSPEHNLRIATLSNLAASYFLEGLHFLRVDYDRAVVRPRQTAKVMRDWLDLDIDDTRINAAAVVLNAKLRHFVDDACESRGAERTASSDLHESPAPRIYEELAKLLRDIGFSQEFRECSQLTENSATAEDGGLSTLIEHLPDSSRVREFPSDTATLYWRDSDEPWDETRSVTSDLVQGHDVPTCVFDLPRGVQITQLRFDPSRRPGTFLVHGMRIDGKSVMDLRGRIRDVNQSVLDLEGIDDIVFTSNDADPWIEIDVNDLNRKGEPGVIEVDCERQVLGGKKGMDMMGALLVAISGKVEQRLQSSISESFSAVEQQLSALRERRAELDRELAAAREREGVLQAHRAELEREVAAGSERESGLRARNAELDRELTVAREREGALQVRSAELKRDLAATGEREARFRQEAFWVAGTVVELRTRLEAEQRALGKAHDTLDEKQTEIEAVQAANCDLAMRHDGLQRTYAAAKRELVEIQSSTIWRALIVLRSLLLHVPGSIRVALRRIAKAGWWFVTPWRTPARISFLRHRRESPNLRRQASDQARADATPLAKSSASDDQQ